MGKKFFDTYNGQECFTYVLENENFCVEICDFGARINSLKYKGMDVVLGFNSVSEYINSSTYAGATIGRVANRIAKGEFSLSGEAYRLSCNEGKNHLHGGNVGFDKKFFDVEEYSDKKIVLSLLSPDGEEGYPGNLKLTVTYTLSENSLNVEYKAISDKDTLFNPTNHTYFNLDGENSGDCRDNIVQIFADRYTIVDGELIPIGKSAEVDGTAFDFRKMKAIRRDFTDSALKLTNGYDHNYELIGEHAAHIESSKTGISMDVYTDMPCMQLYTGGALKTCKGKTINYGKFAGFCLEPQYCPNAINLSGCVSHVLNAGKTAVHYIKYLFNVK